MKELTEDVISKKTYVIRTQKVMLDSDLAKLYAVETKVFNQAVKRNIERFPSDFMFQLTEEEYRNLRSQIVTSSWGGRRTLPHAFSEHGILMLSSVLNSRVAIQVNIQIIRVFTKMRMLVGTHQDILLKLERLEKQFIQQNHKQNKQESEIQAIFNYLKQFLVQEEENPRPQIGFKVKE